MDETLILLKSLINGAYAECFHGSKDVQRGVEIGKTWENYILDVCDQFFFYEQVRFTYLLLFNSLSQFRVMCICLCDWLFLLPQIENCNQPFLDALKQYDDGRDLSDYNFSVDEFGPSPDDSNKRKLAYRHRLIAHKYKKVRCHGIYVFRLCYTSFLCKVVCVLSDDDRGSDKVSWEDLDKYL